MVNSITAAQTHIPRSARVSMHFLPSPASKFGLKVPRATFISRCSILQWEHELRNQEPTADESIPRFTRSSCSPIWSFAVCEQRAKPDSYSTSVCKTVTTSAILRTFSRAVVCDLRKRAVHPWSLIQFLSIHPKLPLSMSYDSVQQTDSWYPCRLNAVPLQHHAYSRKSRHGYNIGPIAFVRFNHGACIRSTDHARPQTNYPPQAASAAASAASRGCLLLST